MTTFEIVGDDFMLDGQPFRVLSGSIHYARVHPEQWRDRIRKAKAMGLNTIETYIPWNAHVPQPGQFVDTGSLDLGRFLDIIAEEGMYAFVRPGPYICAEWDGGGLPSWLFLEPDVGVRANEPQFLAAVRDYYRRFGHIVASRQIHEGGAVILVQVENEYGAYGDDADYLAAIRDLTREIGITVPLTTVDQPTDAMLAAGGLPDVLRTGSFGSQSHLRLDILRRHQPTGPLMCSEFWIGWFDSWGEHHHTTSVEDSVAELRSLLERGASVNIYMFHGGTNYGFTNGANDKGTFHSITTSYDYDALLDEAGNETEKYWAFREVLAPFSGVDTSAARPIVADAPTIESVLVSHVSLWDVVDELGDQSTHVCPPTMDERGAFSGFAVYSADIHGGGVLEFGEIRDRVQVFADGVQVGTLARENHERRIVLPGETSHLDVLVEDLGRVNYGPRIGEPKGLIGGVHIGGREIEGWFFRQLDLERVDSTHPRAGTVDGGAVPGPSFAFASFDVDEPERDHFLNTDGWGKGVAWINGFSLGRYWSRGPQRTLYVPAPVLRPGTNELVLFELHAALTRVSFVARPDLGPTEY